MKKKLLLLCLIILSQQNLFATHNRGGEITYRHLQGFEYEITIITYTKASATAADHPVLDSVQLGDNTVTSIPRNDILLLPCDIKRNRYITIHTYPGQGIYRIYFVDPNRTDNLSNMIGSVNVPFCIEAYLVVFDPALYCVNNSAVFDALPICYAQHGRPFRHNLTARDPDHDSLTYELISCMMAPNVPVPGYFIPNTFSVDVVSGEIRWNSGSSNPQGEYGFAVRVNEWRHGYKVGYVMRDFQINLAAGFTDTLNIFDPLPFPVDASGNYFAAVNPGDTVNVHAVYNYSGTSTPLVSFGESFQMSNPPAVQYSTGAGTDIADFQWIPDILKARAFPYAFAIRGTSTGIAQRQSDLTFLVYVNGVHNDSCPVFPFIGINELPDGMLGLNIYPNPVSNQFIIFNPNFMINEVEIYDALAQKVYSEQANGNQQIIDVTTLANGIYFVKAKTKDGIKTQKIIVQH